MSKKTIGDAVDAKTAQALAKMVEVPAETKTDPVETRTERKTFVKKPNAVEEALNRYPAYLVKFVNLIKSNSDLRRYTALGILNYLYQKGEISKPKGYISWSWTKFRVTVDGLSFERRYNEPYFINCLVAAFTSFANAGEKIIKTFCSKEFDEQFVQDDDIINEAVDVCNSLDNAGTESE